MKSEYDSQAMKWKRTKPSILSDFIARPAVFKILKKISKGKIVLDLGCGEGYVSRKTAQWAKKVIGIDRSKGMIALAIEQEKANPLGISYSVQDATKTNIKSKSVDICVGNFICNHLSPKDLIKYYKEVSRVLKDKGIFIMSFPHPVSCCLIKGKHSRFKSKDFDYIKSRGKEYKIRVESLTGQISIVSTIHSTIEDHFDGINKAGLGINQILEPVVSEKFVKKYPFYKGTENKTPFMILVGIKHGK